MPPPNSTATTAAEIARILYQALAAAGHAGYCSARLGPLFDEESGRWSTEAEGFRCTCGRDAALGQYETWREGSPAGSD